MFLQSAVINHQCTFQIFVTDITNFYLKLFAFFSFKFHRYKPIITEFHSHSTHSMLYMLSMFSHVYQQYRRY